MLLYYSIPILAIVIYYANQDGKVKHCVFFFLMWLMCLGMSAFSNSSFLKEKDTSKIEYDINSNKYHITNNMMHITANNKLPLVLPMENIVIENNNPKKVIVEITKITYTLPAWLSNEWFHKPTVKLIFK